MSKDFCDDPRHFMRHFGRMAVPPLRTFRHLLAGSAIKEGLDDITVTLPLPGYSKDDIDLHVGPDTLIIGFKEKESSGEKESTEEAEQEPNPPFGPWWFFAGPLSGSVKRIPLPVEVDPDTASAKLENGVLRVTIKKKSPENEKKVEVE
jgi:HSP20 family protein